MTDFLGLTAYLLLPAIGIAVWRLGFIRSMPLSARLSVAGACGALIVALTMASFSLAGVEWSRASILGAAVLFTAGGIALVRRSAPAPAAEVEPRPEWVALTGSAVCVALTAYGAITARLSCGDFAFTWGPKAIRWYRAGGIDPDVLHTWPQLTVDYPPLHTLLLAFTNTVAQQFPWWAGVLATPLFFLATLAVIRAWSGDEPGTLLVASTMAWVISLAQPAGAAEPTLLLFEAIVIGGLTLVRDPRAQTFLAAAGCAGAVLTKLEGTTFTIATVIAILAVQKNVRRAILVAVPAALLFGAWMFFVFTNGLLFMYGGARLPIHWAALPVTLTTLLEVAKYQSYGLPWIVPVVLIALGNTRQAAVPVSIAVLTLGATVYFYVHYPDPVWWIESSSPRVLMTPLLALLIGAVAAWRKPAI